ncbi:MAG: alpha/beta hydrolase-fold protein [Planctomycetota bacterium]
MFRQPTLYFSHSMGRDMHLWQHGNFGAPVLVFPSAGGMAHEWEHHGMVEALSGLIDGGRIKLYCVESNVSEAWTDRGSDPDWRIGRHHAFEQFVMQELVPLIRADCRSDAIPLAVAGCSMGGFYAANFALKNPETFRYALCMSSRFDISEFTGGSWNGGFYFNNPMAYTPNMDGEMLERVRRNTHLALVCGQGAFEDGNHQETRRFGELLAHKGISHECDLWGQDVAHEWVWWGRQVVHHLGKIFG